ALLSIGLAQFIHFEPPGQKSGLKARISGIYPYDVKNQRATGSAKDHFRTDEPFAAVVDWSSLPPDLLVGARWFTGGFAIDAGGVGPARAGELAGAGIVPVNMGADRFPPGRYQVVVERFARGRPVEVIARSSVLVAGSR
ncbi:MAG: hypothetical protein M3Z13_06885, partial [Candidatus Dormibacteraeota bacterium]|nr:hypothetical protein [Candidatus Dormibacteraeota bacterium]